MLQACRKLVVCYKVVPCKSAPGKLELSLNDTSGNQNADELNEDNDLQLFVSDQPE